MKNKFYKKEEITFHPMGTIPDKKEIDDNNHSKPILLFDICEENYCEIGYYHFKEKKVETFWRYTM